MNARHFLWNDAFPKSNAYDPQWVLDNEMGPNALWLTEFLTGAMDLKPGMRVLDMGCGRALSSVFLAKEYGVTVWANDWWIHATDNWRAIRAAGWADKIFPIRAEARALPYAQDFFDAIVSVDSYHYYGTDDLYLNYFHKFVKPGGQIGILVPGLAREFDGGVPEHLSRAQSHGAPFWSPAECGSFHTATWWRAHWENTELVTVERLDTLKDGWKHWVAWEEAREGRKTFSGCASEGEAVAADAGRYLGFVRMIARRKPA